LRGIVLRHTLDDWTTTSEVVAGFGTAGLSIDACLPKCSDGYGRFASKIDLVGQAKPETKTSLLCIKCSVSGQEYWDNNNSANYQINFRKKSRRHEQSTKDTTQAPSQLENRLRQSRKLAPATISAKRNVKITAIEPPVIDKLTKVTLSVNIQIFKDRYNFDAALSVSLGYSSELGDRGGHVLINSNAKRQGGDIFPNSPQASALLSLTSAEENKTVISPSKRVLLKFGRCVQNANERGCTSMGSSFIQRDTGKVLLCKFPKWTGILNELS
jgi:hypothetical protein